MALERRYLNYLLKYYKINDDLSVQCRDFCLCRSTCVRGTQLDTGLATLLRLSCVDKGQLIL